MKIFLLGFMGCGKTHWGKLLSEKLNIPFFDLDEKIIEHEGRSVAEIFAREGEEYFRLLEKDVLHILTESHDTFVMATGGGTPCFYNNIDYLKKRGNQYKRRRWRQFRGRYLEQYQVNRFRRCLPTGYNNLSLAMD